jgi:2,4-dienoyl-CoA reductase (NADPH2)
LVQTALRLSATDSIPFPYGFGVPEDPVYGQDLSEPVSLIRLLIEKGCSLMNGTIGNPHHKPHLGRPFDRALPTSQLPDEHPMEGVERLIKMTAALQALFPEIPFVGTGYSWLRQFLPHVGAAVVAEKKAAFLGVGRSAFAYPDAPRDCMETGSMDVKKVCITCSLCTRRMRAGLPAGCGVRDTTVYGMHMPDRED